MSQRCFGVAQNSKRGQPVREFTPPSRERHFQIRRVSVLSPIRVDPCPSVVKKSFRELFAYFVCFVVKPVLTKQLGSREKQGLRLTDISRRYKKMLIKAPMEIRVKPCRH